MRQYIVKTCHILAGVMLAMVMASGAAAQVRQLNMGGSSTTSSYYPYYTAIANSISKANPDLNVTVVSSGGFAKNQALMMGGDLHFGGISPDLISDAADNKGYDKFRVLWWANPAVQNIMARKDSGIRNIADFDGKCFHPGMTGSSSLKNMTLALDALGIKPKLYLSDSKDAINAIKNGRCLGQVKSIGGTGKSLDGATAELNVSTPMWPIGYTDAQVAKIRKAVPWMGFFDVPPGIVDGAPGYTTHAIWVGFAAPTDMDEDTAYKIVKSMWEGIEEQRLAFKHIAGVDIPRRTLEVSTAPLHAGAIRYYREIGLDIPDRLIPPEAR